MSSVENRIVTMQFNNRLFEAQAAVTMGTLAKLKSSMNFGSIVGGTVRGLGAVEGALSKIGLKTPFSPMIRAANTGLAGIGTVLDKVGLKNPFASGVQGASELQRAAQAAGGPQGMGALEGGITGVSNKFLAMSTIAITALSNITNRAISSGTQFLKSFTFGPVMDGLHEYELNLKSIQTVQANTDQPLDKINRSLDELNEYSDQTIYNFAEMARNVGTFTAAGVDLDTSVSSIKGIANLAALSGSSSEQAATAMYQLSQAIAAGKVGLMDWNSVVNAGMGGKKLQNALAQTAVAMGDINANAVKMEGPMQKLTINGQSFRESIMAQPGQESWLSSDILVNTLATMDGRFSAAALAAEKTEEGLQKYTKAQIQAKIADSRAALEKKNGVKYTDEQFKALQKMSTMAFKSATEVKTLGQVFDIVKETLASGWSASFRNIFGDLKEAKKNFTAMKDELTGIVDQNALARNTMLKAWADGGGRAKVIEGIKNSWQALLGILGPIRDGFRDIFPAMTADRLLEMSASFAEFTEKLIPSESVMENIRDVARGLFAILGIGKIVFLGVVDGVQALLEAIGGDGGGAMLDFAGDIGNVITRFHDFLKESDLISAFFTGLGRIIALPLGAIKGLAEGLGSIFDGFDGGRAGAVGEAIKGAVDSLSGLSSVGDKVQAVFKAIGGFLGDIGSTIGNALVNVGSLIASFFTSDAFEPTLDAINTGLLAGITAMIVKYLNGGFNFDITGGLFDGITETLSSATSALNDLQTTLKANIILKIGIAIGILALSLLVLSSIDPQAMKTALGAMAAGFGILIGALVVMMKFLGPVGILQIYAVSTAMTKLAAAILLLSLALRIMSSLSFGEMLRGLFGLGVALFIITKALVPLSAAHKGMAKASFSLILLGVAMNILAVALKIFASMSWEEMAKGLIGLTGTLLALAAGLKLMPEMNAEAVTLIALGIAINLLAVALKIFATMSWEEMAKGLIMLAGGLGIIGVILSSMSKGLLFKAAALVIVAGALNVLAVALKVMASMSWEEIAKGLVTLSGALVIIAIGLQAIGFVGTIGAIGLLAAAGALAVLAPILVTLGAMSWESIIKGLVGLAGIFAIIGVAGYLLTPVIPVILGLGIAILALGAGLALAGAGALAAATAFGIVVSAGAAGAVVMSQLLGAIIAKIPPALKAFGQGVVQFAVAIGNGAPRIAKAFGNILSNLLDAVIKNAPKLAKAFLALLNAGIKVVVNAAPRIAAAGLDLIMAFLNAVNKRLSNIIDITSDIIVKFINGIGRNLPRIIQAGVKFIISFIQGLSRAIENNSEALGRAAVDLGAAIVSGIGRGLAGGLESLKQQARNIAADILQAAKDFLRSKSPSKRAADEVGEPIPQGVAIGMKRETPLVLDAATDMGKGAVNALKSALVGIDEALAIDPNFNPTVTPVLDLSEMTKEANKMSAILGTSPITPSVSYMAAADISASTQSDDDDLSDGPGNGGPPQVFIEQNNYSPKPLDSVQVFRDSKTLIALAKESL